MHHIAGVSDHALMRRTVPFSGAEMSEELRLLDDEMYEDDAAPLGEKKKRLKAEQVDVLEKSFEFRNKLDPERKMQLAEELGMQPRQVAVWFQNRRARWKSKKVEKDFELMKRKFEVAKADNELLRALNKQFHSELLARLNKNLGGPINLNKENEASWIINGSENNINVNLGSTTAVESGLMSSNFHPTNTSAIAQPCLMPPRIFQGSMRPDFQAPRIDPTPSDQGLSNVFDSIEEQPSFWPWP